MCGRTQIRLSNASLRVLQLVYLLFLALPCLQGQVAFFGPPTYAGTGTPFVADFNGDGKPDILSADGTMQLGNGDGTFRAGTPVTGGVVAVADFNGDGKLDVLQLSNVVLLVLLGNGDGTFQSAIITTLNTGLQSVIAEDLTGNGKADVLGLDPGTNSLVVYLSKGDGTFASGVSYPLGVTVSPADVITLGDFNGDHLTDIAVSLNAGKEVVFLGNGNGTFQTAQTSAGVTPVNYAVAGDFDNDGKLDLVVSSSTSPSSGSTSIFLGNGNGTFAPPATLFSSGGSIAAADLNGDGSLDLVVNNFGLLVQIWLGNGNATFSNTQSYPPNDFLKWGPVIPS
jgi:hypothetical protein